MPSKSPPPQRPQTPGSSDLPYGLRQAPSASARISTLGSEPDAIHEQTLSITEFFAEALDGALALVHADGGEIATLDNSHQVLVLRARRTRPHLDNVGAMGMPARHSQPQQAATQHAPAVSYASFPFGAGHDAVADEVSALDEIEVQSTQLLPATLNTRTYRKGERLIGLTWQRGEPVIMRGEECRTLAAGAAPPDADAPWHLAVPILRPASLASIYSSTEVIGVISVYNRDPLWSFSARDVELLMLHADRIARAMRVADLARQTQSQVDMLDMLGVDAGEPDHQTPYLRLRDIVRRTIDAPSFAVMLYHTRTDEVSFELAERDGQSAAARRVPASLLPPWWAKVRAGHTVCISAPEDRARHPEYCMLGWGGDQAVQSILAAPMMTGNDVVGVIVAGSSRTDVYAPEHAHLFGTIARSAAIVVQNALLAEERRLSHAKSREKEWQLSLLNNAVLTLNASLDLDATLQALIEQATLLTGVPRSVVFLLDDTGKYLTARAGNVPPGEGLTSLRDVRVPVEWRGLGKMLESGQFVPMDNLEAEWEDDTPIGRLLATEQVRSCLVLPLVYKDSAIGVLMVYTPGQRHHLPTEAMGLIQGLASQAAVAISNAQYYQQLQRAYERQKELDRLKDEFILTVSHEFRTPVTAIDGYVTLISRHGHKLEQSKLDQFAAEIRQATNQLMSMINMLHDANIAETQSLQVSFEPVNVRVAAEQAIATQSPETKARTALMVPEDLWVSADTERLSHVFWNLLSNAIKYSPANTPCEISARVETRETLAERRRPHVIAEGAADRWVVVDVHDWGEGITPEEQKQLFQKFHRLPRSLTTSVRGTGLGLWICRQYLDAMGGDIWIESDYGTGAGSHFVFCLPYVPPTRGAQPSSSQGEPSPPSKE